MSLLRGSSPEKRKACQQVPAVNTNSPCCHSPPHIRCFLSVIDFLMGSLGIGARDRIFALSTIEAIMCNTSCFEESRTR
eukprot:2190342-Amphidinium_carterae.1